jgi:hypothetical protein
LNLRVGYRIQQFLAALNLRGRVDTAELRAYLSPAQVELFLMMPSSDQRHALAVLQTLQRRGWCEPALAQAALLHDVGRVLPDLAENAGHDGRSTSIRVWHRVAAVLLEAFDPALLRRLALNNPGSWRYAFFVLLHHASRGANIAQTAGTHPLVLALIRWHHSAPADSDLDPHGQALLAALKSADEQN